MQLRAPQLVHVAARGIIIIVVLSLGLVLLRHPRATGRAAGRATSQLRRMIAAKLPKGCRPGGAPVQQAHPTRGRFCRLQALHLAA